MKRILIFLLAIIAIAALGFFILQGADDQEEQTREPVAKQVEIANVSDLSVNAAAVTAFGQVVSSDSVSVVPERSGVVFSVNARLGDTVRPGQVIVQLQNSTERQSVLQAQAQLDSARASLTNTTRDADSDRIASAEAQIAQARSSRTSTEASVLTSLDQSYTQIDSLIVRSFSEFFNGANSYSPNLRIEEFRNDGVRLALERELEQLNRSLEQDRNFEEPKDAIEEVQKLLETYNDFSNSLRTALGSLEPSASLSQATLTRWNNDLVNTRNSARSIEVTLNQLQAQIDSADRAVVSAEANLQELRNGANTSDVTIAQSSVSSARASLASAQIELARTQITSPIFGRVSSIDARVGQLVGPQAPAFVITSSGSKRVDIFVSETEARRISVGDSVTINGTIEGSISRISPSIDAETGKIKVEVFPDQQLDIVEGAGVKVSITSGNQSTNISVPIGSVFVRSGQAYVYVVREGLAIPQPISTAGLFGPSVEVRGGLQGDEQIILSARSVKDNERVVVEIDTALEEAVEANASSTTE